MFKVQRIPRIPYQCAEKGLCKVWVQSRPMLTNSDHRLRMFTLLLRKRYYHRRHQHHPRLVNRCLSNSPLHLFLYPLGKKGFWFCQGLLMPAVRRLILWSGQCWPAESWTPDRLTWSMYILKRQIRIDKVGLGRWGRRLSELYWGDIIYIYYIHTLCTCFCIILHQ